MAQQRKFQLMSSDIICEPRTSNQHIFAQDVCRGRKNTPKIPFLLKKFSSTAICCGCIGSAGIPSFISFFELSSLYPLLITRFTCSQNKRSFKNVSIFKECEKSERLLVELVNVRTTISPRFHEFFHPPPSNESKAMLSVQIVLSSEMA